ncbi:MAG: Spx/MgsR family RNA polymerase-binding regulatory protein [Streptococcaceae bacterium]|jgi:arsenate reductase|nr:Spx/MgsR family RNA polymerase-binding regulatory protein [Streptococcaceae bacterium]
MSYTFICYPKCSTCKKAANKLIEKGISFEEVNIKSDIPTVDELKKWLTESGLPLKRFFNTSGNSYRSLDLKNTFETYSEAELLRLLSKDGMLIKRPILLDGSGKFVSIGYARHFYEAD